MDNQPKSKLAPKILADLSQDTTQLQQLANELNIAAQHQPGHLYQLLRLYKYQLAMMQSRAELLQDAYYRDGE